MNFNKQIEQRLYKSGVKFVVLEEVNFDGDTVYHYTIGDRRGFCMWTDGNMKGSVLNTGMLNWARKEGFTEEFINQNIKVWLDANTVEQFVKMLIPQYQNS